MEELIEAKTEGKELVVAPPQEAAPIVNLMDWLRQSMKQSRGGKGKAANAEPPLPSVARRMPAPKRPPERRRKSG